MNQLNTINNISALLSRFVIQTKALNSINQYGINYLSETVIIPLFKEIYGYNLKNLNDESNNFPGIDLGDIEQKLAIQITSTSNAEKIRSTIESCLKYKLYKSFDTFFIYCLTEKSDFTKSYSELAENKFYFNAKEHVLDYRDLMKTINSISDYDRVLRIENLLTKQFSEIELKDYKLLEAPQNETVFSNLLRIALPSKLYMAQISVKRKDLSKKGGIYNDRQMIFRYKKEKDLKFSSDWIDHNKQLFSFHDISNHSHDISKVIDLGTVETISPEEFYLYNDDQMRAFKALLKLCFSKYAHYLNIEFNHLENLFIFMPNNENAIVRSESWHSGKRHATRDVIRMKLNKKTNDVWYYTHLAFSILFKYYENQWFLEIIPDWYVTKDGYQKHYKQDELVSSWLKRNERNIHVFNNTKFIANYLKYGKNQPELFYEEMTHKPKNFIDLMGFETFRNSPTLNEENWKANESKEVIDLMNDKDGVLDSML